LIAADSAPKQLTVVSGDHRLQRAAKRRKATAVASEVWLEELNRRRGSTPTARPPRTSKPTEPLTAEEVEAWLKEFGVG
jgi:uncharacterized protein